MGRVIKKNSNSARKNRSDSKLGPLLEKLPARSVVVKTSFAEKTISIVTNRIVVTLVSMAIGIIVARVLGPVKLGIIAIIMIIPQYSEKFGRLGLGTAAVYRISKGDLDIKDAAAVLFTVSIILGSLPLLLFYFYKDFFISTFLKDHIVATWYFLAMLITLPTNFINNYFSSIFISKEEVRPLNRLRLVTGVLPGGLAVMLLLFTPLDIGAVLLGTALANTFAAFYALTQYKHISGAFPGISFNVSHFRSLFGYGYKIYLKIIISFVHYRIDVLIIAYLLTAPQVAFYSMAVRIVEKIWLLNATSTLLLRRVASDTDRNASELTAAIFRNMLWIMGILALALYIVSPWAVEILYGAEFLPLVDPLKLLLPGMVMMGAGVSLNRYFIGKGMVGKTNYIYGFSIIINIALNFLLIPKFGIAGAAMSTTITYSAASIVMALVFVTNTKIGLTKLVLLERSDWLRYREFASKIFRSKTIEVRS